MDWRQRRYFTISFGKINNGLISYNERYNQVTQIIKSYPSVKLHPFISIKASEIWSAKLNRYVRVANNDVLFDEANIRGGYTYLLSIKKDCYKDAYVNHMRRCGCRVKEILPK